MTINGRSSMSLEDGRESALEQIASMLRRMDSTELYALNVWSHPVSIKFRDVKAEDFTHEYLQCAGSRDRLTVEIRRMEGVGVFRQYVIGRPGAADAATPPTELIEWDAHSTRIFAPEVFDADTALPLFEEFLLTGAVPGTYRLRGLEL